MNKGLWEDPLLEGSLLNALPTWLLKGLVELYDFGLREPHDLQEV